MLDPIVILRLNRVQEEVSIIDLISNHYGMKGKEARDGLQLSCCFHSKGGRGDQRASAHAYESSNRFWCFACHLSLSVPQFVAKKEQTSIVRAISLLEAWYKLKPVDFDHQLLTLPNIRIPTYSAELTARQALRVSYRLLKELVPYVTLEQYDRAFVAWWTLVITKEASKDQALGLLRKLSSLRDDSQL